MSSHRHIFEGEQWTYDLMLIATGASSKAKTLRLHRSYEWPCRDGCLVVQDIPAFCKINLKTVRLSGLGRSPGGVDLDGMCTFRLVARRQCGAARFGP
jgi:hypothetical protein